MAVGYPACCGASASPRSRIVFHNFWGLSRLERRLDKPQKLLSAAWIGVMQKKCLKEERICITVRLCRSVAVPPGDLVPASVRPAGAVCHGSRRALSCSLVPGRHADVQRCWRYLPDEHEYAL